MTTTTFPPPPWSRRHSEKRWWFRQVRGLADGVVLPGDRMVAALEVRIAPAWSGGLYQPPARLSR